ncbi:MAG: hypothetical protein E7063_00660 [Spirochaetaceae bacterium]|nr:hypothetical protein [Spirochaetaceae bacterium]
MKKLFIFIFCIFLTSCTLVQTEKNYGELIVSNYSEDESLVITNIYLKQKDTQGYILHFIGEIKNGYSQILEVDPDKYSVRIDVEQTKPDLDIEVKSYETGYNIYKLIDLNQTVEVIFDGDGIYFSEEIQL